MPSPIAQLHLEASFTAQLDLTPSLAKVIARTPYVTAVRKLLKQFDVHPTERVIWHDAELFYRVTAVMDYKAAEKNWKLAEWRITRKDSGELLSVLKARKGGKHLVAFVAAQSFYEMFEKIAYLERVSGLQWKPDRFANQK
jgi:hypothetical protein